MEMEGEDLLCGLEPEGFRMTVAAILRRWELLGAGDKALRIQAPEELTRAIREAAQKEGWTVTDDAVSEEEVAVLIWETGPVEAERTIPDQAVTLCWVEAAGSEEKGGPEGFEVIRKGSVRGYFSINRVFARLGKVLRVPPGLGHACARSWAKAGMDERVGRKMAALRLEGFEESYWARPGSQVRGRSSSWSDRFYEGLASFGWIGLVPLAGATLASLVTAVAGYLHWVWGARDMETFRWIWLVVVLLSTLGCLITEKWAGRYFLAKDPREVVLDETAGMALTLLFLPASLATASWPTALACFATAFLSFRFFDALKFGVRWIDRADWRGSIVWDDLLAGLYAGGATWAFSQLFV